MIKLNLPEFEYKVKKADGKVLIFDIIRRKYVVLTPEEWVRQSMIHFLIHDRNYPRSLIKVESGLKYNDLARRSDILIYDREVNPFMLVECKTFQYPMSDKAAEQLARYNHTIKAPYIVLTNGLKHFCYQVVKDQVTPIGDLPVFPD